MSNDEDGAPVDRQRLVEWEDGKGRELHDVPPSVKRLSETKYRGQAFGKELTSILNLFHEEAFFVQKRTLTTRPWTTSRSQAPVYLKKITQESVRTPTRVRSRENDDDAPDPQSRRGGVDLSGAHDTDAPGH